MGGDTAFEAGWMTWARARFGSTQLGFDSARLGSAHPLSARLVLVSLGSAHYSVNLCTPGATSPENYHAWPRLVRFALDSTSCDIYIYIYIYKLYIYIYMWICKTSCAAYISEFSVPQPTKKASTIFGIVEFDFWFQRWLGLCRTTVFEIHLIQVDALCAFEWRKFACFHQS